MDLWKLLRSLLLPSRRAFELDERLHSALVEQAGREQRPPGEVGADLLAVGLAQLQSTETLEQCWVGLSPREQQVTALTCLGYTNRQIASRLGVAPDTVKGYIRHTLTKWQAYSKQDLRMLLMGWDFTAWGPKADADR